MSYHVLGDAAQEDLRVTSAPASLLTYIAQAYGNTTWTRADADRAAARACPPPYRWYARGYGTGYANVWCKPTAVAAGKTICFVEDAATGKVVEGDPRPATLTDSFGVTRTEEGTKFRGGSPVQGVFCFAKTAPLPPPPPPPRAAPPSPKTAPPAGTPPRWSAVCPTNSKLAGRSVSGTESAGRPRDWIARYCGGVQFRSRTRPTGRQVQAAGMAPALKWTLIAGGVGIVGYVIYRMVS